MLVDRLRGLLVAEMSCTGDGYVAAVRGEQLRPTRGIRQHVGVGVTSHVQHGHRQWRFIDRMKRRPSPRSWLRTAQR